MYTLVVLLAAFLSIQAVFNETPVQKQWEEFKQKYNKTYQSKSEEERRRLIFIANLDQIEKHNQLYVKGLSTYEMGMNRFGDLVEDEFRSRYTNSMLKLPLLDSLPRSLQDFFIFDPPISLGNVRDLPKEMDWRKHGVVTPVKDQGDCGSCYSFSTTGALEAQWCLKSGQLISLSEQNIIDCSGKYGNEGCNGGFMNSSFLYIKENGGINSEKTYPYTAEEGQCRYNSKNKAATVSKVVLVPKSEKQLQIKVGTIGPISVAIAVPGNLIFYKRGVFDDPNCGDELIHGVLAAGYGTSGGSDYWLVKNSWGLDFGEQGYIRMSRNKNNQCGIALMASYPKV